MNARLLSDRELLELEIETLWERDGRGRLIRSAELNGRRAPDLVVAIAGDVAVPAFGADLPDALSKEINGLLSAEPSEAARIIDHLRQRLSSALGPVEVASGPSYVCEHAPAVPFGAGLIQSADATADLSRLVPPRDANWQPWEWELLLNGKLGPWAAVTSEGGSVALCFCARLTDRAAEAGVRTEPGHRRRGYAAAVTAAWASQVVATQRIAFYSTSADNVASQGVAARLGLRPIGWMWQFLRTNA